VHSATLGFFLDRVAGLPLGADEQNVLARGDCLLNQPLGAKESLDGSMI
jgi:hypothetical protein